VPKKYFKKFLPSHESIQQNRWLRPFGLWLQNPHLWHLHRRSAAGGVAAGMFCGLIPGPFQMLGAALMAILFRVNLPVAMLTTLYTNPFTIVPLYYVAYQLGAYVTGQGQVLTATQFAVPELGWHNWFSVMVDWIISLGKPFAIGLPLLAILLAILGYIFVRLGWRIWLMWQWHKHGQRIRQPGNVFTYRKATLEDVSRIVALVNSAYRGNASRVGWTTEADVLDGQRTDANEVNNLITSNNSLMLLCMQGENMIGSVHLQHGKGVAFMGMLVVEPGLQGKGIGKQLIKSAEETAIKMWGVDKILMYVISLRAELIAFYERRGYRRTGKFKDFPNDEKFGIPKMQGLKIELLEKNV
jgi:hypothetical protein